MSNFYERLAGTAQAFPGRPAVEWIGQERSETTTYGELLDESARVAAWLTRQARIDRSDRVAILAGNDAHWVAAFMGALRCGAVVVPLDTAYSSAQVHAILADSGARVLLSSARYLETAREAGALNRSATLAVAQLSEAAGGVALDPTPPGPDREAAPVTSADPAVILYTSGTTSDPKGVVLTHGNLEAEREAVLTIVRATHEDVVLGVLPLFHALAQMANLWLPLTIGARVVYLETVSSTTLLAALETRGITILACVPQFFYLIHQRVVGEIGRRNRVARWIFRAIVNLNVVARDRLGWNPGRRLFARVHHALGPAMRLLITGGSRFDPDIARDLYGIGVSLYNGYGLTETSGAATIVRPGDRFTTSVGPALPGVEIEIDDEGYGSRLRAQGKTEFAEGRKEQGDGEILIRGPIVMREYSRRPDATAEAIEDGWLRTGDLGMLDDDGRLYITGRRKDVIVLSSGKNIYPEEIEAHYRQSPFIKELCVLGRTRADAPAAERLHAIVVPDEAVLRERGIVNIRELIRFELEGLSVQLPPHKRVLSYDVSLEPLARTTTGKLRRGEIERVAGTLTAAATDRPLTPENREWIARGDHAGAVAAIASHLHRTTVHPDANLELDLGLDSMERVEVLTTLEARRGARVAPDIRATIFTVRQLVEAVEHAAVVEAPDTPPGGTRPWDAVLAQPPDPALVQNLRRSKFVRALVIYAGLRIVAGVAAVLWGLRVTGRSNLPAAPPFIISPNHQTFLDGFFVAAALPFRTFRHICFVGAAEFLETRVMAWGAQAINIVPIDPDANLVSAMQAAATGLTLGKVLMLFPEGERTIDGSIKPFRKGAAILASHLDVPIVPVALDGFHPLWPRGRRFDWRTIFSGRLKLSVAFGEPIRAARGDYAAATTILQQRVEDLFAAIQRTAGGSR